MTRVEQHQLLYWPGFGVEFRTLSRGLAGIALVEPLRPGSEPREEKVEVDFAGGEDPSHWWPAEASNVSVQLSHMSSTSDPISEQGSQGSCSTATFILRSI
jgi:hypothetical protein